MIEPFGLLWIHLLLDLLEVGQHGQHFTGFVACGAHHGQALYIGLPFGGIAQRCDIAAGGLYA